MSVKNFAKNGIPTDFAEKLVREFRVKHNAKLKPVDGKPLSTDVYAGDMLINVLPSGEVIAFLAGHKSRREYRFTGIRYTHDGEFRYTYTDSIAEATSGMTKRGPMYMLNHGGVFHSRHREEKPTPAKLERHRTATDQLSGGMCDILNYMNKTYLPHLKPQLEQMVDEIFSNLRKLSKDLDSRGHRLHSYSRDQRAEALAAAGRIEDIIEKGFTTESQQDFLRQQGVETVSPRYAGYLYAGEWERTIHSLEELQQQDPLTRARWAKTLLENAREHWQTVMDMVDADIYRALSGDTESDK
jgi:hypothetical protein